MSEFSAQGTRDEVRRLMALAAPVAVSQLGGMLLGVVDMMMLGHVGTAELAAATLGNIILMGTTVPIMGILMGADPLMSQAHGAGDKARIALVAQRAIALIPLISIPLFLAGLFAPQLLALFHQPEQLIPLARTYILINLPALPMFLAFQVGRQYLQARGIVRPAMWIMLAVNLINVFGNWVLIYGHLGAPALGIAGSAISTCITRGTMVLAIVIWIRRARLHEGYWRPWDRRSFEWRGLREIASIGLPITTSLAVEMWAFQIAGLLAGGLGEEALAAHSLVFQILALVFMVPLGVSIGSSVRVGNLIGAGDSKGAQRTAYVALALGGVFMGIVSLGFVAGRNVLPLAFTNEPDLIATAAILFPIAAAFQIVDGSQTICTGILRGMGSTRLPAVAHGIGFYILGLPAAWAMLHTGTAELTDIWWGLCIGLFAVASLMISWVHFRGPATAVALTEVGSGA
jgi:MATE family multidrug resistance protein